MAHAGVAQLVEHLIRNEGVAGSSPVTGTRNKSIPKWGFFIFYKISQHYLLLSCKDNTCIFKKYGVESVVMKTQTIIIIK